ncbi:MAG: hypothetical protein IJ761_07805 [Bacteroidales bacterium]|nr:hypothetical protein [Bacteroidales bacterium]
MERLFRNLWNGFGSSNNAFKAVCMAVAIMLGLLWLAWKIVALIIKIVKAQKMAVPNFKMGNYDVQLTEVGPNPRQLKKELCRIKGYSKMMADKVMKSAPCIVVRGVDAQDGEDFQTLLGASGATIDVVPQQASAQ